MPLTTYTAGQVLTASSLNANLSFAASAGGLTNIKTQTIGSAVASVTVTDAFNATYDNYRIIISGGAASATANSSIQLGATATGYYYATNGRTFAGTAIGSGAANTTSWAAGEASADGINLTIDIFSPFLADQTAYNSTQTQMTASGLSYTTGGYLNNTTSYTAFTFTAGAGTFTGGTIRVYGYPNS